MRLESWAVSDIGLLRKTNQDTVGCFPELGLFLVADGMGGRSGGERASQLAVELIHKYFVQDGDPDDPTAVGLERPGMLRRLLDTLRPSPVTDSAPRNDGDRLRAAIETANAAIFDEGLRLPEPQRARSPCTTVVALKFALDGSGIAWAHVGDSRLYRLHDGALTLLTADHTMFGEAYRDRADIPVDLPHTNVLVQALGINAEVQIASGRADTSAGDVFLLCSDGVSGLVSPPDIRAELATAASLEAAGTTLLRAALDAGGRDNASLVLVRVLEA